ncbi:MAG: hypothetical protein KC656_00595 [Myxococcales bacterium]|nr:hypothetical protein [Myxococcales bacterium]MCB9693659.1 hypothetical protein [Alphaproteobacteria bacterium]
MLAPTLYRARGADGPVLVRLGRPDRVYAAAELVRVAGGGIDASTFEVDGRAALVVPDDGSPGLDALVHAFDEGRVRWVFRELARRIVALHEAGHLLRALDPAGVRPGPRLLVVPLLHDAEAWHAPEGPEGPASDWYVFGHLLYRVLTGGQTPDPTRNAPDPRDVRASAPDDLCSLAMDLLLLEPGERCEADEVLEVLAPRVATSGVPQPWLEEALVRGGVVFRALDAELALQERLPGACLCLDGDPSALVSRVDTAEALTHAQRALVATLLTRAEVLERAAHERACGLLALALVTTGVQAVWTSEAHHPLVHGLLRTEGGPLVLVCDDAPDGDLARLLAAEGIAGVPEGSPDELPWLEPRRDIDPAALRGELTTLGAPTTTGLAGRIASWWDVRCTGDLGPRTGDVALDRQVFRTAVDLLWTDFPLAARSAAWLERRAVARGDLEGAHAARVIADWFTDPVARKGVTDDAGVAWQRLGRAIRHRRDGRVARVEQTLAAELPLSGAGPSENALARLLYADSLIERGRVRLARGLLRQVRVDARLQGLPHVDLAARCLLARTGDAVPTEAPAAPGGLLGWWVARARAERALADGRRTEALGHARIAAATFASWPFGSRHPLAMEASHQVDRIATSCGVLPRDPPRGHALSPAWSALAVAVGARRTGDVAAFHQALEEAGHRFEGVSRELLAASCNRVRGLFLGGVRGGALVEKADEVFRAAGVRSPPRMTRVLLPELAFPLDGPA